MGTIARLDRFQARSIWEMPVETAVQNVIELNRLKHHGGRQRIDTWHVVIAIESQPLWERLEYRHWKTNEGVISLESSRNFHVFDRLTWPVPKGARLELPTGIADA